MKPEQPTVHRTIAGQSHSASAAYHYTEFRDNHIRDLSAEWHPDAIAFWLWGLNLFEHVFVEGRLYNCGADSKSYECEAYWELRNLLALGGRGAKPAVDLLLVGYYTESWVLERTMLEAWVRAVYLRLQPAEHRRFREDAEPGKCEPEWHDAAKAIRCHGDAADHALLDKAQLRWWFLNLGAHPSGEGVAQLYDEPLNLMRFYPDPDQIMGLHALSHGVFVQHALLGEIEHLEPPDEELWFQDRKRFSEAAAPLIDFTEGALTKWSERHEKRCLKKSKKTAKSEGSAS